MPTDATPLRRSGRNAPPKGGATASADDGEEAAPGRRTRARPPKLTPTGASEEKRRRLLEEIRATLASNRGAGRSGAPAPNQRAHDGDGDSGFSHR